MVIKGVELGKIGKSARSPHYLPPCSSLKNPSSFQMAFGCLKHSHFYATSIHCMVNMFSTTGHLGFTFP